MNAKQTFVELEANGQCLQFELSHAERLLRMPRNGGWKLPENSPFKYSEQNGIEYRRNKERNKKQDKEDGNSESDILSEQD